MVSLLGHSSPPKEFVKANPLLPYLFVLCVERLARGINEAVLGDKWKPLRLGRRGPPILHLLFADDLLLFVEASIDQAKVVKEVWARSESIVHAVKVDRDCSTRKDKIERMIGWAPSPEN
ncbi:conserved hypothetical protein [Ricinus communis]|uniref:Reverse transcriptase domain-containing protein n=1 Tax=Ricinus communis TaxID=3988 RepID=B9SLK2_RICCO|nr:conserved hypothetical protein [Ricinus communis]